MSSKSQSQVQSLPKSSSQSPSKLQSQNPNESLEKVELHSEKESSSPFHRGTSSAQHSDIKSFHTEREMKDLKDLKDLKNIKERFNEKVESHLSGQINSSDVSQSDEGMMEKVGHAIHNAWNYLEVSYHDFVWSYDDWMNDLNFRISNWRDEIKKWELDQIKQLVSRMEEFKEKSEVKLEECKKEYMRENKLDTNVEMNEEQSSKETNKKLSKTNKTNMMVSKEDIDAFYLENMKNELMVEMRDFYECMMNESERVLIDWIDTAYERFEHVKSQLTDKDKMEVEDKYQQLKQDAIEFASASNKRADEFYEQCLDHLEKLGLKFEEDMKIEEMKKKANELINKQRIIWSQEIEDIKKNLFETSSKKNESS